MKRNCRRHSPAFKAKVAIVALKSEETVAQLAIRVAAPEDGRVAAYIAHGFTSVR